MAKARQVLTEHKGGYGAPRVHATVVGLGEKVCRQTVAWVMASGGLRARRKPRFVPHTTDSAHEAPVAENLLERRITVPAPDRRWVCDITYIPTGRGGCTSQR